jgi:hypothetical protein
LSWVRLPGAESCIGTTELAQAVEQRLRRQVFTSAARADVSVEGRVQPREGHTGWRAVVVVSDAEGTILGERVLDTEQADCSALNEPLGFVIAVMIDPDAALQDAPAAASAPQSIPAQASSVPAPAPPALRLSGSASASLPLGFLPLVTPGARLSLGLDPGWWVVPEAEFLVFPYGTAGGSAGTVRLSAFLGGLGLCSQAGHLGPIAARGCVGLQSGALLAQGVDLQLARPALSPLLQPFARVRATLPLIGPLHLLAGASLVLPLVRDRFVAQSGDDSTLLFQATPLGGMLDLGVELRPD